MICFVRVLPQVLCACVLLALAPFCRLWEQHERVWEEGTDAAEQCAGSERPGPAGGGRQHRLLALPGGRHHPAAQPEHRHTHVPALRPLEGLLPGRSDLEMKQTSLGTEIMSCDCKNKKKRCLEMCPL